MTITHTGDVITVYLARRALRQAIETLLAMPKPSGIEAREPIEAGPGRGLRLSYLIYTNIAIHARDGRKAVFWPGVR